MLQRIHFKSTTVYFILLLLLRIQISEIKTWFKHYGCLSVVSEQNYMFILVVNVYVMTVCSVYTLCCGVQFYAVFVILSLVTMKNRIYAYEKLLQFISLFSTSPKEKHVCWHSIKRRTRLFATFDTTWVQNSCWCGYWPKKEVALHIWYFVWLVA